MTARTAIGSDGKPRRVVLNQPPHFRTVGSDPTAQPESEKAIERAVRPICRIRNAAGKPVAD